MKNTIKIALILIGIFLLTFSCKTSKTTPHTNKNKSHLSQDKLGNIYQLNNMKVVKYSSSLDSLHSNSIFSNGSITSLDTRNPLQLMLFYKQQQEIILLDNTLSTTNKISLRNFEWIDLACMSNRDNAFWLYSINTQSLIKTDKSGKVINRVKNISQLVQRDLDPSQLIEYENEVYLFDSENGLFVFDLYGNYEKRMELKNAEKVVFFEKKVFYRVKNSIFSYNLMSFDKKKELELDSTFDDFVVNKKGVLIVKNESLIQK